MKPVGLIQIRFPTGLYQPKINFTSSFEIFFDEKNLKLQMSRVMRKQTFWLPIWFDTNQAVQLQKIARGLKFRIEEVEELYYRVAKTKALISFAVTAKLICVFVF